jgi:hypothetical protein
VWATDRKKPSQSTSVFHHDKDIRYLHISEILVQSQAELKVAFSLENQVSWFIMSQSVSYSLLKTIVSGAKEDSKHN